MNEEIERGNKMKQEFITFRKFGSWEEDNLIQENPSCFNGIISVNKYKITIEQLIEPLEIIHERLEKLFVECDNWHHREPLDKVAKKYDYKFKGEFGSQRKRK